MASTNDLNTLQKNLEESNTSWTPQRLYEVSSLSQGVLKIFEELQTCICSTKFEANAQNLQEYLELRQILEKSVVFWGKG